MTNFLNSLSTQTQNNNAQLQKPVNSALNIDTTQRIKPFPGEGHMLPSRIFGSPVNYLNNLKQDVVTIKKGAKGHANDHELGRLNDLAMKAGSLLLAAYLFTTKPFKSSKAMEFVGFGSFFAAMALWPKLAIQAPLKARTGVDIHQKYQDSQGRQKMFFQDPQYVPWDLVSQEQLDKIGKRLNISEDTPNRNAVIQEQAQKIAVQGNTLWMMTAGIATPVLSALGCRAIEPQVDKAILNHTLKSSQKHLEDNTMTGVQKIRVKSDLAKANKYIESLSNEPLTEETIEKIAAKINTGSIETQRVIAEEISTLAQNVKTDSIPLTEEHLYELMTNFIKNTDDLVFEASPETLLETCRQTDITPDNVREIAKHLVNNLEDITPFEKKQYTNYFTDSLLEMFENETMPKVSSIKPQLFEISGHLSDLAKGEAVFDRFLSLRTQQQPNTLLGNRYRSFSKDFINMIGINPSKTEVTDSAIEQGIEKLVKSNDFNSSVDTLAKHIDDYKNELNMDELFKEIDKCYDKVAEQFRNDGYEQLSRDVNGVMEESTEVAGTLKNALKTDVNIRLLGAKSSFYRTVQTLDLFKKLETGDFENSLKDFNLSAEEIETAKRYAKDFLLKGTIVDYSDCARYMNEASGKKVHNAVMEVLFNDEKYGTIIGDETLKSRMKVYKDEFKRRIIDTIRNQDSTSKEAFEGITRHNLVGEPVVDLVKNAAQNIKNSNKWLKIFGTTALALTGVTLAAGAAFGRQKNSAKAAEGENK